ncbi:hypothetical protein [Streptomyces sp. WZ.A104]|uniref:hypothetical protein n=1 Tax=Streptomyces sp. WZ.A104 TaxID=2023771 RepID=UPI0015C9C997|nr:hypothetical protein [Streptomyces sp. WZ.A104]
MTAVDERAADRPRTAYTSPECRAAAGWPEGHKLCAGNIDLTTGGRTVERLRCGCSCHT